MKVLIDMFAFMYNSIAIVVNLILQYQSLPLFYDCGLLTEVNYFIAGLHKLRDVLIS